VHGRSSDATKIRTQSNNKHQQQIHETSEVTIFQSMLIWLIGLLLACGSGYLWSNLARDYYLTRADYAKRSKLHHDLSLFSECGFYYSFYEQVAGANDTADAMQLMLNDRLSEYPDTINAMVKHGRETGHHVVSTLTHSIHTVSLQYLS
jgi:hypothetical protein